MIPLSVVCWKWQPASGPAPFSAVHVNVLRSALQDKLKLDHRLYCVTDDAAGIDGDVTIVPLPERFVASPRCRRRMQQFDGEFSSQFGRRILAVDLDLVFVGDLTPIVRRPEPIVCLRIEYANVFSGSFLLMDAGVLHPLWERFSADPEGFAREAWPRGIGSDQAMLNYYLQGWQVPCWTGRDGFVTYFGTGYERFQHLGVGPGRPQLPKGARVVVLGSADLDALEPGRYAWADEHWGAYARRVAA